MRKEKTMSVAKVGVATSLLVAPFGTITHADTYNDPTVNWSNVSFVPYLYNDGTIIYDPANEPGISPDDVDFSSGYSKGSGDKPSFYVGSDGANLFFRMRLHGEPYDRKGGFLSSVWLVDIAHNGVHKATVGLNGKSPHEDYIYVSNANGTIINKINATDSSGSHVPGSRIVEAENGEYFLDFQVPISRISEVAPEITANSTVQFFFGTSKAANLSVINKDYMGPNSGVSFQNAASVKLNPAISFQIPTISITSTANFENLTPTFTGTTTKAANGSEVTLSLNNKTYKTTVANGAWSVVIPTSDALTEGTYPVTAKVVNEFNNIAITKQEVTVGKTITIDGPSTIRVSSFPSTVSGTFTNNTSGSKKVLFRVTNSSGAEVYSASGLQMDSLNKWSKTGISLPSLPEGTYVIEATEDVRNNTNLPRAYKTVIIDNQINVEIKTPANNTSSFNAKPTITGTSDPEAKVELFINGIMYREVKADTFGNWSVELDKALSFGPHTFKARATDEIGNTKESLIVNYNVTSLDIDIANGPRVETNDRLPTIRGRSTAPDGSKVTVKISDTLTLETTVKNGKWSVNVEEPLSDITYYVQATVTSGGLTAQAHQELVIDSTTFISITSPINGSITENRREPITGKSEPLATIDVNFDNGKMVATVFADENGNWTYIPEVDLTIGQHQITVTSSDVNGNNAIATTNFYVNAQGNKIPTVPAGYTEETLKNTPVSGVVVGNDEDGDALTYSKGTNPSNGTVAVNPDGTWIYTPTTGYIGTDTFTVVVSDGKGGVVTTTITIQVNEPVNQVPTIEAKDLYKTTLKNTPVSGTVDGKDADGDPLTYSKGLEPSHGSVVVKEDGTWTYTPGNDYIGEDSFSIVVSDGRGGTATATITIQVNEPPNQAPTIGTQDLQKTTLKNTAVSGTVVATDADGDALTFSKGTDPGNGTVIVNADGTWTYTPSTGYTGTDTFTITVSDGKGGTATATISIQVNEQPNQVPTIEAQDLHKTTLKNTAVSGTVVATDADGDALTYVKGTNPSNGTVVVNGDGTWTYTPAPGYTGTDSFTITVSDGKGGTATATITIQVNEPPNQAPTIGTQDLQKTTLKNTAVSGAVVATDVDGDVLTFSKGTDPSHGTVFVNEDGKWTYTPRTGYTGSDSFTVVVSDGKGGTATATITIQVNEPPNQAPTIGAQDLQKTTLKNTAVSGTVVATDADGDALTFSKGTNPSNGTVVVNGNGTWTYTPAPGFTGMDSFTVTVSDGKGGTATATITIQVNEPPNQAPTIGTQDLQKTTLKNTAVSGAVVATDADGDTLTFSKGTDPSNGTVVVNEDGKWTYTPRTGYTGSDSFTVVVSDGKGGTATATITIQVNEPPNQAPTIGTQDLQKITLKNTAVSGAVVATDADGDTLTFSKGTDPSNGTVVVNEDGKWTYTPRTGYTGSDSFTVVVSDGKGGTATATITIQVNEPPNQAPTIGTQDLQKTTLKNTTVSGAVVATDADGDTLTFSKGSNPSHGTVVVNGNGTWTYTPANGYTGTDSFTVTVSDGKGGTATATITIQVNEPPNQVPMILAQDLQKTTLKNMPVSGAVVGTDGDGDILIYSKGSDPSHGTVLVNGNGGWTYTPTNGYTGTDSFTVTVSDGKGGTATATITIQINEPPNQAPTINAQDLQKTTLKNTPVSGVVVGTDADGDALTYSKDTNPSHGTVVVNGDGTWSYTPANGYTGTDSFTITVSDGKGGTATARVTIQVNEPPYQESPAPTYSIDIDGGDKRNIVDRTPLITGTAMVTDFNLVTVELRDKNGNVVERGVVSVVSGKWSYQTTNLLNPETYTVKATLKEPNGTREFTDRQELVIDEADMFIKMEASPASIVGDGKTRAIITAVIKDANGRVIAGEKVTFTTEAGTLTKNEAITNSRGEAVVELISPDLSGTVEAIQKQVKATVSNPDKGLFGEDHIVIQFLPASISGVIIDSDTGKPIPGAFIEVREDFNKDGIIDFSASVITDSEGKYTVAVPYANWNYQIVITTTRKIGNQTYPIEFIQNAKVGQTNGKGESFKSESTVSGQLFMMNKDTNTAEKINSVLNGVEIRPTVLNDPAGSLNVVVDASGKFQITGGEKGKTYQVVFNLHVKDAAGNQHILIGHRVSVFIPEEGIASVQALLIDPFGIVTDDVTGLPISGVKAQLYWADTELNRSKGRTPNTLVNLPVLEGFAPSDNRVPQFTDKFGAYAWMVFPEGDYYIVAEKDGYVTFDSRTEGRDVPSIGEDSYILDGIIHVGYSIVEFNFSMTAIKGPDKKPVPTPGNQAPTIGDYQFKIGKNETLKQTVVGTDPEKALLTYSKQTNPKHGTVIVKKDGSFTYTPSPGFVGTDEFIIDVFDDKGAKASGVVKIVVEEKSSTTDGNVLIETFVNRTINGDLEDIQIKNPTSIEIKSPDHGMVNIQIEKSTWSYTPDPDFIGKDQFIVYYYDENGVLYTQIVDVLVHPKVVKIDNKPIDTPVNTPKDGAVDSPADTDSPIESPEDPMKELPKTGSPLDRNVLLGAASLLTTLGLVLRRTGRRKKDS
jgi:VCBS repeat-containing protein